MTQSSPLVMVIFGATGDLMHRKLMSAFYHLIRDGAMSPDIYIVGVGRRPITTDQFREMMAAAVQENVDGEFDLTLWQHIIEHMHYVQGKFEEAGLYDNLTKLLESFDEEVKACVTRFFYLATPPQHYETILTHLAKSKLSEGCGPASHRREDASRGGQETSLYTRVLIEKPFGKDLDTARHLDQLLAKIFEERQIYRIDHYLGKETVQNILSFRFANGIFEPTWNNKFIDHIQITLAEDSGVGTRGEFYDGVGTLRDVVQNHMVEMLSVIAMDQPRAFDATSIRDARVKIVEAINCIDPVDVGRNVVRGQYEGYTKEKNVDPGSQTETFVALKLTLDTPRWRGVPFYLRAGIRLPRKTTEISIHFKKPKVCYGDVCLFPEPDVMRNVLSIRIDPYEGVVLRLMAKKPGFGMKLAPIAMNFTYKESFADDSGPMAYERLLLDAIRGDQTLFSRTDEIQASWSFVTKILNGWSRQNAGFRSAQHVTDCPLHIYTKGTWGPAAAAELLHRDEKHWYLEEG